MARRRNKPKKVEYKHSAEHITKKPKPKRHQGAYWSESGYEL